MPCRHTHIVAMKSINTLILMLSAVLSSSAAENVRVVWSTHPQTEAVVVWDAAECDDHAALLYDTVSRKDQPDRYAIEEPVKESGLYVELHPKGRVSDTESTELFYHQVPMRNLRPDTVYYLAVRTAGGISREYHFKTAPAGDKPFKLIYAGDSRTHIDIARSMSAQISDLIEGDESIIALLHGGDYAGTTKRTLWKTWLEAYALTTTEDGRLLPIIPIIGNHDVPGKSPIFRQAYGYPGGKNDYYTCRLTPSVGILCLNTEISAEGDQKKFLRSALVELGKDKVKWQIAAYHKPAFPAIKKPSAAKVSWVPLFEEFNIDLGLESDGHCIKRTVPIRNGQESADGIVYLGEGGYGAPQRNPKPDRWYIQGDHAFASKGNHIMMLEITPDAIHYSTILNTGEVVDSATFKPRR